MANGPQFIRYMLPILHALREMGGSATASEVTDAVIERESLVCRPGDLRAKSLELLQD
jgi:hypothetical protein